MAKSAHTPGPRDPHPAGPFQSNGRDITAAQFYWEMFNDALVERDAAQVERDRLAALNVELVATLEGVRGMAFIEAGDGSDAWASAITWIDRAIAKARSAS